MISIVTPNYNGERWLDDCLSSVANQTIDQEQIEMIIVDDGSTDNSKDIIKSYSDVIPGMRSIWNEHTGKPGALRNIAIDRAIGKYVLFLDSDDFLGKEALERLTDFIGEDSPDVVAFQLKGLGRTVPSSMLKSTIRDADIVSSGLYKTLGTWKMCRRDFLNDYKIRFSRDISRGEDILFFTEAMTRAKEVSVLSGYPFYTVRGREDGTSITQKEWNRSDRIDLAVSMGKKVVELAKTADIANHFMIRAFNSDVIEIISSPTVTESEVCRIRKELGQYWKPEIEKLIYTEENREILSRFFKGEPYADRV